jgi:hypothetical protein
MKFLFVPFSIAGGLLAGLIGKKLFEALWGSSTMKSRPTPSTARSTT